MKKKFTLHTLLAVIIACTLLNLTSCEKHDGINYLKSKCTAELNGQEYIANNLTHIYLVRRTPRLFWNIANMKLRLKPI